MALDLIARDLATQAFAARSRARVALGIVGQSNEHGSVAAADAAAWPQAFQSQRKPSVQVPFGPAVGLGGGWWPKTYDDLWDWGYDLEIVNAAIGSASLITHFAGFFSSAGQRSAQYYQRRLPAFPGDRGYVGDLILVGGNYYRCTVGNNLYAANSGPGLPPASWPGGTLSGYMDFIQSQPGQLTPSAAFLATAASAPTFGTAIGSTTIDGSIVWTCEGTGGNVAVPSPGNCYTEAHKGFGFDPLGLLQRLHEEMQRIRGATRKIIYIANGQTDLGTASTRYSAALQSIANFFLARGYEVMIGLTCFKPDATSAVANYDLLDGGVTDALAALRAGPSAARVWNGANLYRLMGTSGPMALGGAFLQGDNTHLNGAGAVGPDVGGVSCAGKHVGDALKAALPRIWR